jgi:predicted RNA-binding Zn-ribbon protein involved in translation (DUF1610 family)
MDYQCPNCGNVDSLDVCIETWARLKQGDDNIETDTDAAQHHDHVWNEKSVVHCARCGETGMAKTFEVKPSEQAEELVTV